MFLRGSFGPPIQKEDQSNIGSASIHPDIYGIIQVKYQMFAAILV